MRRRHAATRSHEAVINDVASIRERFDEELHQCSGKRCGMRALAALCLHFDYVRRARDAGEAPVIVRGSRFFRRRTARARTEQTAAGGGSWIVWRIVEAIFGDVPQGPDWKSTRLNSS